MNNEYLFIVFGYEHYNPLGLIRSLGESGINPIAIIIRGSQTIASKSKYISQLHMVDSIDDGYNLLMERYGICDKKAFLYTCDDGITSFLDERYDELKKKFVFFNAGCKSRITYYMNKENINMLARKHGLNVLDTIVVEKGIVPEHMEYPIITKSIASTIGGWKKDVFICNNEDELVEAYNKIKSPIVLIQKYIRKKNELCLDGFSINAGNQVMYAIASNYNYILPDTYSSYMTVYNYKDDEIKRKLNAMFKEVGFEGIFSVEFLIDSDDTLYFCEINFRNSTWSYASTCAGMNLPVLWAQSMVEGTIDEKSEKMICENFTAMDEFHDYKIRVSGKKCSIWKWFSDMRSSNCKYYFNKKDIKPVFSYIWSKFMNR